MPQPKTSKTNGSGLFEEKVLQSVRRIRRQRALFIPRFLRDAGASLRLEGAAQDRAYDIALRWADLETDGHLPRYKQTVHPAHPAPEVDCDPREDQTREQERASARLLARFESSGDLEHADPSTRVI